MRREFLKGMGFWLPTMGMLSQTERREQPLIGADSVSGGILGDLEKEFKEHEVPFNGAYRIWFTGFKPSYEDLGLVAQWVAVWKGSTSNLVANVGGRVQDVPRGNVIDLTPIAGSISYGTFADVEDGKRKTRKLVFDSLADLKAEIRRRV